MVKTYSLELCALCRGKGTTDRQILTSTIHMVSVPAYLQCNSSACRMVSVYVSRILCVSMSASALRDFHARHPLGARGRRRAGPRPGGWCSDSQRKLGKPQKWCFGDLLITVCQGLKWLFEGSERIYVEQKAFGSRLSHLWLSCLRGL